MRVFTFVGAFDMQDHPSVRTIPDALRALADHFENVPDKDNPKFIGHEGNSTTVGDCFKVLRHNQAIDDSCRMYAGLGVYQCDGSKWVKSYEPCSYGDDDQ